MAFIRPQQDFTSSKLGEEFYHGVVVDNVDPDNLRRLKIRIEDLHGTEQEIPDANLPWAIQFRPTFLGGNTNLSTHAIPRIGSDIVLTHIRGDIHQPAYLFELSHNTNRMEKGEEDYPDSYVLRDSDDNFWHVNMVQDKLDIKFNGDECLEITIDRDTIIGQDDTETVGRDDTRTVGRDDTETINRDKTKTVVRNELNTIQGTRTTEVTGDESKTVRSNQSNTIDVDRTENIGNNLTQTVTQTKTVNSTRLIINTSADVDINASANVTIDGSNVILNGGSGGGVVVSSAINHATGVPHGDSSGTVTADY